MPYRLALRSGRVSIRSEPIPFREPGERQAIVTYRAPDAVLEWQAAPVAH